jgi:hypothetical protein
VGLSLVGVGWLLGGPRSSLAGCLSSETKGVMGQVIKIDNKPSPERSVYFGT